jgi:diguanylate cyclase (GGDEF)-like protein
MNDPADRDRVFAINLMQDLVVPTFVLDAECRVIIWNRACERLTGVAASEVIGTRKHWRAFYGSARPCLADLVALGHTDQIEALYTTSNNAGNTDHGVHAENWCLMPQIGNELYLAVDAGPIYDADGRLIAVVETLRDMTEHKRAQIALEHLASCDGLTGVANRRSFDQKLSDEWLRGRRDRLPVSLLLLDVDHFKHFNDAYGHQRGDECLRRVASAAADVVFRPGDMVARYGGEEFGVILPATDIDGALLVADRMRDSVMRLDISHSFSEVGCVTLSIGVASTVPALADECEILLGAADTALYRAKHAGRNRVVTVPVPESVPA